MSKLQNVKTTYISLLVMALVGWTHSVVIAQTPAAGEPQDADLESLYDKDEVPQATSSPAKASRSAPNEKASASIQSLSDLAKLAPFSDIATIQRRFLPKTNRFEASGSGFTNLNNPFFSSYGLDLRLAYYFRERYAVEGIFNIATTASRQVTDDLQNKRGISTSNEVTSEGFYGLAFKWNPIYGKITWLNKTIVPFDLNFSAGLGMTQTTGNESEPTLHLGTSQVFALSKAMAFRWNLSWNIYQANVENSVSGAKTTVNQNDLFLGFGMSFFFPEASYR